MEETTQEKQFHIKLFKNIGMKIFINSIRHLEITQQ